MPHKGGAGRGPRSLATPRPALERCAVVNLKGLEKDLLSVVLPPFSGFLDAVLSHYHLDPCSLILLSSFAFLCEAFVGVTPSVALLYHFFSLGLASKMQCSRCVSLKVDDASAPEIPGVELLPEAEGFRRQWVLVEAAGAGALFQPPLSPATPKQGWEREELGDPRLAPVLTRLGQLRRAGVSMVMVVREFICQRIAPLQRHSRPMWAYARPSDSMGTQAAPFSYDVPHELLRRLTSRSPDELPRDGQPLYRLKALKDLTAKISLFYEWGLLPEAKEHSQGTVPPGVRPHEDPDRVAASGIMEGDAPAPIPPTMARGWAGDGDDDWSITKSSTPAIEPCSRAAEPLCRGPPASRKRRSFEGGRPLVRGALVRKRWMAIDQFARREGELQYLTSGWSQLEFTMNLGRLQRERACVEAEASLVVAVVACESALGEALKADCRCRASENRHKELCTLIVRLEPQAPPMVPQAGPPTESFLVGPRASADSLVLEGLE
ncbi:hypothetical protein D1007_50273 [Hordeum vulgare]|nr:hypothetical protein D1007_50273 [Hordeum vulgare]